jgi:hypothetical protein
VRGLGALEGAADEAARLVVPRLAQAVEHLAQQVQRQRQDRDAAVVEPLPVTAHRRRRPDGASGPLFRVVTALVELKNLPRKEETPGKGEGAGEFRWG